MACDDGGRASRAGLPPVDYRARRRRLVDSVVAAGLGGVHVTDAADLAWTTGFTGSNGALLLLANGDAVFATDGRYAGRVPGDDDLTVRIDRDLFAIVSEASVDTGLPIAFDPEAVTHARARTMLDRAGDRIVARGGLVAALRLVKDAAEVARLARACAITVTAWQQVVVAGVRDDSLVGMTERGLATRIERAMVDLGADGIAFDSIVAAGPNGAIPHHEPSDRAIASGDLVTTDIGAVVAGYHADFTRTVVVGRDPDPDLVAVHEVVQAAQSAGVAAAVVGAPIVQVDTVARDVVTSAGHGDHFVHGVGHGVGLVIHEAPLIALAGTDRLSAGMVLTVEPGIYLPGRGGVRIEDTVAITDEGPRVLTVAPTGHMAA